MACIKPGEQLPPNTGGLLLLLLSFLLLRECIWMRAAEDEMTGEESRRRGQYFLTAAIRPPQRAGIYAVCLRGEEKPLGKGRSREIERMIRL